MASEKQRRGFTLIELLVSMAVMALLVVLTAQMISGVSSVVNRDGTHLDEDGQARALLDRMALDFTAMVKRPDVDYYLKGRPVDLTQPGNDQIAFYTEVAGYFDPAIATNTQSPTSLVAYRVNARTLCLERLCKGMVWNAASTGNTMGFLPVPLASPLPSPLPSPTPAILPDPLWPQAAAPDDSKFKDLDYEVLGPQVFRFEYYYVLKGQAEAANGRSILSVVPWYAAAPISHNSVEGMRDVAGIGVLVAVLDQKSRRLLSTDQLAALAKQMPDVPDGGAFTDPGYLERSWMAAVSASGLPLPVTRAIRVYTRCFFLNGVPP